MCFRFALKVAESLVGSLDVHNVGMMSCNGHPECCNCFLITLTEILLVATAGSRVRRAEAVPLQVSRLLEERVAAAEGVATVRLWLSLVGALAY